MDNPLPAARTPAAFALAIGIYVTNVLPHFAAQNTARVAKSATEIPPALPLTADDHSELLALRAEKASGQMKPAKQSNAKHSAAQAPVAPRAPRQLAAGAPPFYCWSHGNNFTGTSPHYSHGNCKAKKTGHKKAATFANQMGGTPA